MRAKSKSRSEARSILAAPRQSSSHSHSELFVADQPSPIELNAVNINHINDYKQQQQQTATTKCFVEGLTTEKPTIMNNNSNLSSSSSSSFLIQQQNTHSSQVQLNPLGSPHNGAILQRTSTSLALAREADGYANSIAETVSRRRYAELSPNFNGPVMTRNSDGVISIQMDAMNDSSGFYLRWQNLSYTIRSGWPRNRSTGSKRIFSNLNGYFLSGELIALMGPSGAGKTTLLKCLAFKNRDGVEGDITVVGKPKIRVALVPQHDEFLPQFTVTETIYYASRYKNRTYDISHRSIVRRVIQQLGLETCQNNSITRCSGGQRKRVAIAQELVKRPNVLILDEPTSGLDSSSCYQTIGVLRHIIDASSANGTPMSIVTTIHQPSAKVMSLFDRCYLLSTGARVAFNGSPADIVATLSRIGSPCPPFYNPIDYMIEIVAGDYGLSKVDSLCKLEEAKRVCFDPKLEKVAGQSLRKAILYDPCPFEDHLWIHFKRSTYQLLRDPILFSLRILLHLIMAFFFASLWGLESGKGTGCPTFNKQTISPISASISFNLTKDERLDVQRVNDNVIFAIYGGMFTMYAAAMITVLTFPLDVKVLAREHFNGWYSVTTYLVGKISADAPFQVMCVLMFATISYQITGQPKSDYNWRFVVYAYCLVCLSLLSQTQGLIVGAIFMNNLSASVFVGPLTITPVFLFSGFTRRYARTANYLKPFVKLSYFHHAVKTIYSALYGFGRCRCNPNDYHLDLDDIEYDDMDSMAASAATSFGPLANSMDFSAMQAANGTARQPIYIGQFKCDDSFQSLVMNDLGIEDQDMFVGMAVLFGYLVVLRTIVLLLVMHKVER